MRCKNIECKEKFSPKFFLQKYCSKKCSISCQENKFRTINKKSEKRKLQEEIYTGLRKAYLLKHPSCEICYGIANQIHHKNGRNGGRLNDISFFMSVCADCHRNVHAHPKDARQKGWLI